MPNRTSGQNIQNHKLRGEWAELRFVQRATERGFRVTKPWGETAPYDIATDHHGHFLRVQACPEERQRPNGSSAPSTSAATPTPVPSAPAT